MSAPTTFGALAHTDAPDGSCVDCAPDLPPTNEETCR